MNAATQLERCTDCAHVQFPPRGFCSRCLSANVAEHDIKGDGELLSWALLHVTLDPALKAQLPLTVASVKLSQGPVVIAYFDGAPEAAGQAVTVQPLAGPDGAPVLVAWAAADSPPSQPFHISR